MSFLDNLEDSVKAAEGRDEGGTDNTARRDAERNAARASAGSAERLKRDPWTQKLMQQATQAGYQRRMKVNLAWIGTTLRLEWRGQRLELRPTPQGINAVFGRGLDDLEIEKADLDANPAALISKWMAILEVQRKLDEEASRRIPDAAEAPE
jgi:hypothetical protein